MRTGIKIIGGVTIGAAALTTVACGSSDTSAAGSGGSTVVEQAAEGQSDAARSRPVSDPLTDDGMWLVGDEIQAGNYRVTSDDRFGGYWARCADAECAIDMDGDESTGLIDNGFVTGSSIVHVGVSDFALEVRGVTLTPLG